MGSESDIETLDTLAFSEESTFETEEDTTADVNGILREIRNRMVATVREATLQQLREQMRSRNESQQLVFKKIDLAQQSSQNETCNSTQEFDPYTLSGGDAGGSQSGGIQDGEPIKIAADSLYQMNRASVLRRKYALKKLGGNTKEFPL